VRLKRKVALADSAREADTDDAVDAAAILNPQVKVHGKLRTRLLVHCIFPVTAVGRFTDPCRGQLRNLFCTRVAPSLVVCSCSIDVYILCR
jgi:hypothetical protein